MKVKVLISCIIYSSFTLSCNLVNSKSEVMAEVSSHHWRRTIVVEQLEKKTAEVWENELPNGAKIISKRQDIHHYDGKVRQEVSEERTRKVQCGSTFVGGKPPRTTPKYCDEKYTTTVTKDVDDITKPVYATKVKYELEVWTEKEKKDFTGYDKDISKAETVKVDNKTTRLGSSNDSFMVELKTPDNRKYPQNVTKEVWEKLNKGNSIKCQIDLNQNLSNCEF